MVRSLVALSIALLVGCGAYPATDDAGADAALGSGDATVDAATDAGFDADIDAGECASDADCPDGLDCDLGTGTCTTECRTGTRVGIDVPTVSVSVEVTLDGAPLPLVDDTGATPHISLRSSSSRVPLDLPLYERDSAVSRVVEDLRVVLAADTDYDVLLTGGGALPLATNALIDTIHVDADSARITIDVPSAVLLVRAQLGGGPLPIVSGEAPAQVPSLWLYSTTPSQGVPVELYERVAGRIGSPIAAQTVRVLPGVYLARYWRAYQDSGFDPELPLGSWVADEALDLVAGGLIDVNIPRGLLEVHVTLDGASPPTGGSGLLSVVDEAGRATQLPRLDDTGTVSAWLVPGTYAVRYRGIRGSTEWPVTDAMLGSIVVDSGTVVANVDVPRVRLNLSARLERDEAPAPTCLGSLNVGAATMSLRPGDTAALSFYVTPGRHQVRHQARSACGAEVPLLAPRVLTDVLVETETSLEVVLPMLRVDLDLRFDGIVPAPFEADGPSAIGPELTVGSGTIPGPSFDAGVTTLWVSPGTYAVHYRAPRSVGDAGDWPMTDALLFEDLVVDADRALMMDVTRTRVQATFSVGGAPVPSYVDAQPWATHPPQVQLTGTGPASGWGFWESGFTGPRVHDHWAIPGRYELEYDARPGRSWSADETLPPAGVDLGCWLIP